MGSNRGTKSVIRHYTWMKTSEEESLKFRARKKLDILIPTPLTASDKADKEKRQNACGGRDKNEQMRRRDTDKGRQRMNSICLFLFLSRAVGEKLRDTLNSKFNGFNRQISSSLRDTL